MLAGVSHGTPSRNRAFRYKHFKPISHSHLVIRIRHATGPLDLSFVVQNLEVPDITLHMVEYVSAAGILIEIYASSANHEREVCALCPY
jgi:hypothetical protein